MLQWWPNDERRRRHSKRREYFSANIQQYCLFYNFWLPLDEPNTHTENTWLKAVKYYVVSAWQIQNIVTITLAKLVRKTSSNFCIYDYTIAATALVQLGTINAGASQNILGKKYRVTIFFLFSLRLSILKYCQIQKCKPGWQRNYTLNYEQASHVPSQLLFCNAYAITLQYSS